MLKKPFILILAVFYLAIASGVVVNIHYCMGKMASVNFNHDKDHDDGTCNKCGMDKTENHCCNDETQYVKLTDSHQSSTIADQLLSISIVLFVNRIDLNDAEQGITKIPSTDYFSPPPKNLNKVYLALNVFRI